MLYESPDGDRYNLKSSRCEDCGRMVNALTGTLILLSDGLRCPACMTHKRHVYGRDGYAAFLQAEGAMTLTPLLHVV